ncbi:MAG TPA: HD domain-containing protein [Firmicutes bacterium]|nr:HD domain-containing protein [Bacillota bacterium]
MHKIEADLISTISGFSRAGDLNNLEFLYHAERVAYTSWRIGRKMQFSKEQLYDLVLSALLHDFGIMTTDEKLKLADLEPEPGLTAIHCERGYELLKPTKLFGRYARTVLEHHDYYTPNMSLMPAIIHLADRLDHILKRDKYYLWQIDDILAYFQARKKKIFHPAACEALAELGEIAGFWLDLQHGNYRAVFQAELSAYHLLNLDELEEIAHLMAVIVDSKSPFTGDHSLGVARVAAFLAAKLGMGPEKVRLIKIAALLHDVGKLAVPDEVLMHPGRLDKRQRDIMKQHTYHTYYLIGAIGPGAAPLQRWAAYHHERLNGTGYPFALGGPELEPEARLIAVADITQSLLEARPYRPSFSQEKITEILLENVRLGHLDGELTQLALDHLGEIAGNAAAASS